jgi:adenylate cyclase
MIASGTSCMRRRLDDAAAAPEFPILKTLQAEGFTDWLALLFRFGWPVENAEGGGLGLAISYATQRSGGWDDGAVVLLRELGSLLALAVKAASGY